MFPGGYQVHSEGEDQGWAGHGSHSPRDWDHVIPPPPTHHLYIWRWGFSCVSVITRAHTWQITHICLTGTRINKNTHVQNSPPPTAHSALVAKLQDCHVMTCRCHNKTWTTALGCYSSSLLCLAAWASKSLDGFECMCVCAHVCVESLCV